MTGGPAAGATAREAVPDVEGARARIVALEEHHLPPDLLAAWRRQPEDRRDLALTDLTAEVERALSDLGDGRIADMDAMGVDVQVLSPMAPGVQQLDARAAVEIARSANDRVAAAVRARPDRLQALAMLPTPDPEEAARELERAVRELGMQGAMLFGRTGDRNLDHPAFAPILETAASLRAPLYLHPQSPPTAVRRAYYSGFGDDVDADLATAGVGWHYETGMQFVRLALAGTFDRLPDLQVVVGHWGEVVTFYLERLAVLDRTAGLDRPIADYFRRNLSVTPSGLYSHRYLRWAVETLGADRVMFSTDYPLIRDDGARRFVEQAALDDADQAAFAHGNWDRLVAGIRR